MEKGKKFMEPHPKLSIIGLGKLGLPMLLSFVKRGFNAIGMDKDRVKLDLLSSKRSYLLEDGVQELLDELGEKIRLTQKIEEAVENSDITFVVTPTPTDISNKFSLEFVKDACIDIGRAISSKQDFHLVVITSTIMPRSMECEIKPLIEDVSRKRCGEGFGLCYNPEFIALGSVIRDFINPDLVLIGESDRRSGDMLEAVYRKVCTGNPTIARMNFVNAEITKISINSFITMKITYANMLARICERTPWADVDTITRAVGVDTRIGPKCLKGALGYGGPCFPRDNLALAEFCKDIGIPPLLPETINFLNMLQVDLIKKILMDYLAPGDAVAILGLSYKPNTNVIERSQGIELALEMVSEGISTFVYDPVALENAREVLSNEVSFASSIDECLNKCKVVFIATPWEEFKDIKPLCENMNQRPIVIDAWGILEPWSYENYIKLGRYLKAQRGDS